MYSISKSFGNGNTKSIGKFEQARYQIEKLRICVIISYEKTVWNFIPCHIYFVFDNKFKIQLKCKLFGYNKSDHYGNQIGFHQKYMPKLLFQRENFNTTSIFESETACALKIAFWKSPKRFACHQISWFIMPSHLCFPLVSVAGGLGRKLKPHQPLLEIKVHDAMWSLWITLKNWHCNDDAKNCFSFPTNKKTYRRAFGWVEILVS